MFSLDDKIYIRIDNHWFDLTNYKDHPGGLRIFWWTYVVDA
jgi:cytochrome b involved in lipid metabolism